MRVLVFLLFFSLNVFGQGEEMYPYKNNYKYFISNILINNTDYDNFRLYIKFSSYDNLFKDGGVELKELRFKFKIINNYNSEAIYQLYLYTDSLSSISNRYKNVSGIFTFFNSPEHIDFFIKSISKESINEYLNKKKSSDILK